LQPAEDGKVILANGEAPKTVELASIHQIMKPKPVITDLIWKGSVDAALDFQRAQNNTDDYNIAFKTSARNGYWRQNANGELGKPLSGVADYSLDTEIGLRYKVTDWASLNLKAEKNLISGASEGDLNTTRYTAGFGVTW
jgi:hypothetical protein